MNGTATETTVLLNTGSRRARQRLASLIGRKPTYYFTWDRGGVLAEVTEEEATIVLSSTIKGITRARLKRGEEAFPCWNFSDHD